MGRSVPATPNHGHPRPTGTASRCRHRTPGHHPSEPAPTADRLHPSQRLGTNRATGTKARLIYRCAPEQSGGACSWQSAGRAVSTADRRLQQMPSAQLRSRQGLWSGRGDAPQIAACSLSSWPAHPALWCRPALPYHQWTFSDRHSVCAGSLPDLTAYLPRALSTAGCCRPWNSAHSLFAPLPAAGTSWPSVRRHWCLKKCCRWRQWLPARTRCPWLAMPG